MRYFNVVQYLSLLLLAEKLLALRCRCNTSKGKSECHEGYCDIHNINGRRAACGVVRMRRETHFACVLIKETSNDTYCHVVKNATACWCRDLDFCNVELEARLDEFDLPEQNGSKEDAESVTFPESAFAVTATPPGSHQAEKVVVKAAVEIDDTIPRVLTPATKIIPSPLLGIDSSDSEEYDNLEEGKEGYDWDSVAIEPARSSTKDRDEETNSSAANSRPLMGDLAQPNADRPAAFKTANLSTTATSTTVVKIRLSTEPLRKVMTVGISKVHSATASPKEDNEEESSTIKSTTSNSNEVISEKSQLEPVASTATTRQTRKSTIVLLRSTLAQTTTTNSRRRLSTYSTTPKSLPHSTTELPMQPLNKMPPVGASPSSVRTYSQTVKRTRPDPPSEDRSMRKTSSSPSLRSFPVSLLIVIYFFNKLLS